ncbi:MAG: LytTR family transcriptional regulator DNA-binding domain-containing protein [Bacteroidia bacterium]
MHRSYIIRIDKITSIAELAITIGGHTIPLSRDKIKQLKARFSRL